MGWSRGDGGLMLVVWRLARTKTRKGSSRGGMRCSGQRGNHSSTATTCQGHLPLPTLTHPPSPTRHDSQIFANLCSPTGRVGGGWSACGADWGPFVGFMIGPVGFMAPRVVSVPRLFAQVRRVLLGVCVCGVQVCC